MSVFTLTSLKLCAVIAINKRGLDDLIHFPVFQPKHDMWIHATPPHPYPYPRMTKARKSHHANRAGATAKATTTTTAPVSTTTVTAPTSMVRAAYPPLPPPPPQHLQESWITKVLYRGLEKLLELVFIYFVEINMHSKYPN